MLRFEAHFGKVAAPLTRRAFGGNPSLIEQFFEWYMSENKESHLPMIEFISGDIFQSTTDYIAHGVATGPQEGLGTGLALKLSTKWSDAQQ